jgi:hypothetical protein
MLLCAAWVGLPVSGVVICASGFYFSDVVLDPYAQLGERSHEVLAQRGQGVFDLGRYNRVHLARDQTVPLQAPQGLGEHLLQVAPLSAGAADRGARRRARAQKVPGSPTCPTTWSSAWRELLPRSNMLPGSLGTMRYVWHFSVCVCHYYRTLIEPCLDAIALAIESEGGRDHRGPKGLFGGGDNGLVRKEALHPRGGVRVGVTGGFRHAGAALNPARQLGSEPLPATPVSRTIRPGIR